MSELSKITEKLAANITKNIELSEQALNLLEETDTPAIYFNKILDKQLFTDSIIFLANALPKREAVWWACVCAKECIVDTSPAHDIKAIELAEAWVYKSVQKVCDRTYPAAEATEFTSPAGWAAIAAFWSGENISPSKEAVIPPTPDLTGKAVNGAILLASTKEQNPDDIEKNYQSFIAKGVDIANGGDGR